MADEEISGMVHIRFPFESMDDVSYEGMGAEQAQALTDTLRDHLAKNQEPDSSEESISARAIKKLRKDGLNGR